MKAKLIVEGKEFDIEIQDPELQKLVAPKKKTGYEKAGEGHTYSFVDSYGEIKTMDHEDDDDNQRFVDANYYSNYLVAENNARADKLMRQLRRFAVEHRSIGLDWSEGSKTKWAIYYDRKAKKLEVVDSCNAQNFGTIYFDMALHAHKAIETFYNELIWYFTEYKDSI